MQYAYSWCKSDIPPPPPPPHDMGPLYPHIPSDMGLRGPRVSSALDPPSDMDPPPFLDLHNDSLCPISLVTWGRGVQKIGGPISLLHQAPVITNYTLSRKKKEGNNVQGSGKGFRLNFLYQHAEWTTSRSLTLGNFNFHIR